MVKVRKGFTLVELLIVIVIIGILAAAMLLSSGSATASAEASNIVTELRNMKAAALMFFADSMDAFSGQSPTGPASVNVAGSAKTFLAKYMDNQTKVGTAYLFVIDTSLAGDIAGKWFVGLDLSNTGLNVTKEVKEKLVGRAETTGLLKSTGTLVTPATIDVTTGKFTLTDNYVWMVAR